MFIADLFNKSAKSMWVAPGATCQVSGFQIPRGMLYVGSDLRAVVGRTPEPGLVTTHLPVDKLAPAKSFRWSSDVTSYASLGPKIKAFYLEWLAGGRKAPETSTGCLMLFLFGLERRVLHDLKDPALRQAVLGELPIIVRELERLVALYGRAHAIFAAQAGSLLEYIAAVQDPAMRTLVELNPLLQASVPEGSRRVPKLLRVALGQIAATGEAIPPELAYYWYLYAPALRKRDVYRICPVQHRELFFQQYAENFQSEGLVLEGRFEKISSVYKAASTSFGIGHVAEALVDLPDVADAPVPLRILDRMGSYCDNQLLDYSQFVSIFPEKQSSLEAFSLLPIELWPAGRRYPFEKVKAGLAATGEPQLLSYSRLQAWLPRHTGESSLQPMAMHEALSKWDLGAEPAITENTASTDTFVLFSYDKLNNERSVGGELDRASLAYTMLEHLRRADRVNVISFEKVCDSLKHWPLLTNAEKARLRARVWWLRSAAETPMEDTMAELMSLPSRERMKLGEFLALAAEELDLEGIMLASVMAKLSGVKAKVAKGARSPVTIVEPTGQPGHKIRKAPKAPLAVPEKPAAVPMPEPVPEPPKPIVVLDMAKIAQLQAESAEVSNLLQEIFAEETAAPTPAPNAVLAPVTEGAETRAPIMGLDAAHSDFARLLITKDQWSRAELSTLAAEKNLMLDGALERINEASYDAHDDPLFEGDDPIEINETIAKELLACQ